MLILVGRRVQGSGRMFSRTYWWEQDGRMRELHSRPFPLSSYCCILKTYTVSKLLRLGGCRARVICGWPCDVSNHF